MEDGSFKLRKSISQNSLKIELLAEKHTMQHQLIA
jgi:hypothetical protein